MARCAKTQTLFVQMSLSDVDSVRARKILGMQMAVLSLSCYTQPLNNRIFFVPDFFLLYLFLTRPYEFHPSIEQTLKC